MLGSCGAGMMQRLGPGQEEVGVAGAEGGGSGRRERREGRGGAYQAMLSCPFRGPRSLRATGVECSAALMELAAMVVRKRDESRSPQQDREITVNRRVGRSDHGALPGLARVIT